MESESTIHTGSVVSSDQLCVHMPVCEYVLGEADEDMIGEALTPTCLCIRGQVKGLMCWITG